MKKEIEKEAYKRIPFEILLYVADFCEKNGIRYSLAYGTLLGAIRHKGFIPWDDDIDIIMPRKDYERFKQLYHSDRYPFSDMSINKDHPTRAAKIFDTSTFFYYKKTIKRSYGLFVDVFVVDNFPANVSVRVKWQQKTKRLYAINRIKNLSFSSIIKSKTNLGKKLIKVLIKIFPIPKKYIQKSIIQNSQKYNKETTGLVGITMSADNPQDTYPSDLFEEYIDVEFEGKTFKAIRHYDIWLKACYGNYMQLPPLEKQVGRHGIIAYYK